MLFIHPIIQFLAILLTVYAFFLGIGRIRSLPLIPHSRFKWKQHVTLGIIATMALLLGLLGGMAVVYFYWRGFLITGAHGRIAIWILPLILFGLLSGIYMDRIKKNRIVLPLIHGANNLILLILAIVQIVTGWGVYVNFIR
jgi:hypothetical protein